MIASPTMSYDRSNNNKTPTSLLARNFPTSPKKSLTTFTPSPSLKYFAKQSPRKIKTFTPSPRKRTTFYCTRRTSNSNQTSDVYLNNSRQNKSKVPETFFFNTNDNTDFLNYISPSEEENRSVPICHNIKTPTSLSARNFSTSPKKCLTTFTPSPSRKYSAKQSPRNSFHTVTPSPRKRTISYCTERTSNSNQSSDVYLNNLRQNKSEVAETFIFDTSDEVLNYISPSEEEDLSTQINLKKKEKKKRISASLYQKIKSTELSSSHVGASIVFPAIDSRSYDDLDSIPLVVSDSVRTPNQLNRRWRCMRTSELGFQLVLLVRSSSGRLV